MAFGIPVPTSEFVNPHTGLVNRQWYQFLNNLFGNQGSGLIGTANQVLHGNNSGYSAVSLTGDVSGLLPLTNVARGTDGQIIIGQTGAAPAYNAVSGDGTLAKTGALTVTKTGGSVFVASATTDTTNAANITSGTLPTARFETIGAWTPADNSGAALVFSSVSANYTQIGNMIFAYASWSYPVTASGANASISGLPIAAGNANYAQVPSIVDTSASITGGLVLVPVKNTTTANFDVGTPFGPATNLQLSAASIAVMLIYPIT